MHIHIFPHPNTKGKIEQKHANDILENKLKKVEREESMNLYFMFSSQPLL